MDFIGELPVSKGMNTILVVVDQYSKQAHFISLQGLPNAVKLSKIFIKEVFRPWNSPSYCIGSGFSIYLNILAGLLSAIGSVPSLLICLSSD
ncbi:hypothetical protein FKM82_029964 [Ascaphus truei]